MSFTFPATSFQLSNIEDAPSLTDFPPSANGLTLPSQISIPGLTSTMQASTPAVSKLTRVYPEKCILTSSKSFTGAFAINQDAYSHLLGEVARLARENMQLKFEAEAMKYVYQFFMTTAT
jgi:hypothetical protein